LRTVAGRSVLAGIESFGGPVGGLIADEDPSEVIRGVVAPCLDIGYYLGRTP